ncbi:MAG: aldehyde dehydrogenase family protein [Elusimicrobia bacterium]|nr:aldehyde dehydrogenase family protein [Elusimicrobiota bacterium]
MAVLESVDPITQEKIGESLVSTEPEIERAVAQARKAFFVWSQVSPAERACFIIKARDYLRDNREEIAVLISRESGKPQFEALVSEIAVAIDIMTYYSRRACEFLARARVPLHSLVMSLSKKAYIAYEPVGVVGIITPWNYPLSNAMSPVICALLAGNTVVYKPSEATPIVGRKIVEILRAGGLPENVLQVIIGAGDVGAALLTMPIDQVHFTGSAATGRTVAEAAAKKMIPYTLELGGSDPMIVFEDANLERAANAAFWGRFANAGQTCAAVKRVFVEESVADRFVGALKERAQSLKRSGSSIERELGALINEKQFLLIKRQLEDSIRGGAQVVAGGLALKDSRGHFFEPTILVTDRDDICAMKEETFGPVLAVRAFKTEDEAVRLANNTDYGLSASIFTKNKERALALARRLQAGSVSINDAMAVFSTPELPFGGVKSSGIGFSHGGADGLRHFTRRKGILADRWGSKAELYWYPYGEKKYRLFSKLIGWLYDTLDFLN